MAFTKKKRGRYPTKKGACCTRFRAKKSRIQNPNEKRKSERTRKHKHSVSPRRSSRVVTPPSTPEITPATEIEIEECIQKERKALYYNKMIVFRHAILYVYDKMLDAPEDCEETPWDGKGGVISTIRATLQIDEGYKSSYIRAILEEIEASRGKDEGYIPKFSTSQRGRKAIIDIESQEAQIIADAVESGKSILDAWLLVNAHRDAEVLPSLTISSVYGCIKQMKPAIAKIQKVPQGSNKPESTASKARFNWCLQLGIRLGLFDEAKVKEILKEMGRDSQDIPDYFNPKKLTKFSTDQFVTWDETHKKVQPGTDYDGIVSDEKDFIWRFPRDEDGKIDLEHGLYSEEPVCQTKCKYTDEVRLCLGVAVVTPKDKNGNHLPREGRRCKPFSYTGKTLLSIPDYECKIKNEMNCVKHLKNKTTSG